MKKIILIGLIAISNLAFAQNAEHGNPNDTDLSQRHARDTSLSRDFDTDISSNDNAQDSDLKLRHKRIVPVNSNSDRDFDTNISQNDNEHDSDLRLRHVRTKAETNPEYFDR